MQPTKQFNDGAMLPLLGVLEWNTHIRLLKLATSAMHDKRFRSAGNGNSNARVLNSILKSNTVIEELDLSDTGLDDDGLGEICDALKQNKTLTKLNLSRNYFGTLGAERLRRALEENVTLLNIDLSRNALGFQSINALQQQCCVGGVGNRSRPLMMSTMGNYVFEEILNSVTHGVGFLLSIVGAIMLMSEATDTYNTGGLGTDYHFWACALFSFSLSFLFMCSCLFHSFFMLPQASYVLQIFDHIGIYMLIAGSYTPFLMIGLHQHTSAMVLLSAVWIIAMGGAVFAACSDLNNPVTNNIELVLFLTLGCSVFLIWPILLTLPSGALTLLVIGGLAYVVGILFFILGEIRPIYHVVWHCFVMIGAALHWFDVYFFIVALRIGDEDTTISCDQ